MSKRGPQSELNDRNWDDEEEPEDAGIFIKATDDVIQNRVIRRAKRRGISDDGTEQKKSAFAGFGGFSAPKPNTAKPSEAIPKKSEPLSLFGSKPKISEGATSSLNGSDSHKEDVSSAYFQSLKSLNESVLAWIKQHVEKSPYIFLTPIFKDYEKHLEIIEAKKSVAGSTLKPAGTDHSKVNSAAKAPSVAVNIIDKPDAPKATTFAFGSTATPSADTGIKFSTSPAGSGFFFGKTSTVSSTTKGFTFGQTTNNSTDSSTPAGTTGFSFSPGSKAETSKSTGFGKSTFSFGSTPSDGKFSFGTAPSAAAENKSEKQEGGNDDEEYVPPKPEVKSIQENDALYSKRCKLFYQKDDKWVDRGVGTFHLKPIKDTKTQILVRADTNLGNILLNVMLSSSMPASRQGKNNVLLVCIPNPPINPKAEGGSEETKVPIPMLVRVKTGEDADELLANIDERKAIL